ncbi:MAG: dihydroorotate dehydrogenase-like protein [Synechococcaceae bacterium WB8_1B_136]|nr:dihydroorotate dehydrogenase-like protein [Synechococcaceae bacterium WB8_1B_136]
MSNPLATTYLGLELSSPLVVGAAAPLSSDPARLEQLEREGAAAIVLHSLFLEQIERDWQEWEHHQRHGAESYGEALSYLPATEPLHLGLDGYLAEIREARRRLSIPVIASLNGSHPGHWRDAAAAVAAAGADAIELNLYAVPSDGRRSGAEIEAEQLAVVREVCAAVPLPVAVKLSPWYTSFGHMARQCAEAGAAGLVLFNRFYQPDVDIETLDTVAHLELSSAIDQRLPLRWIGLLHGRLPLDLAASGGIGSGADVVRMLMVGAQITQVVAALLRHGPGQLRQIQAELIGWLEQHDHAGLDELRGCLSQARCPDPEVFERAQYLRALSSYGGPLW